MSYPLLGPRGFNHFVYELIIFVFSNKNIIIARQKVVYCANVNLITPFSYNTPLCHYTRLTIGYSLPSPEIASRLNSGRAVANNFFLLRSDSVK